LSTSLIWQYTAASGSTTVPSPARRIKILNSCAKKMIALSVR